MTRAIDLLAVVLLFLSAVAVGIGVRALDREQDRYAVYWLVVAAVALKGSTDLFRPRRTG